MNRLSIKKIIGWGIIGLCLAFYLYSLFLKNGLLHGMILLMLGISVGAILVLAFSFILPSDKKESEELSPEEQLDSTVNLINKLGGDIRKEGDRYTIEYQTRKVEENERTKQERISFIELYKQRLRSMEYEAHNQYVPENHNQYIPDGDYSNLKGYDPDGRCINNDLQISSHNIAQTEVFVNLNNIIDNYKNNVATAEDVIKVANEVNLYLSEHPHPHDAIRRYFSSI
jgi:hypothetical protein